ncbi:MAG: hypothetical protein LC797_02775 [Chloroflexi bacterium]|nr:hypothetical protein [Chloroflexota bacterium]
MPRRLDEEGLSVFLGRLVFTSLTGGFMGLLGDRLRGRDVAIGGTRWRFPWRSARCF